MSETIHDVTHVQNIRYDKAEENLYIIDQTLLPLEEKEILLSTAEEMVEAIRALRVRGAPAIGICAAYCMYALARTIGEDEDFLPRLRAYGEQLNASRPTAVNLGWAIGEMLKTAEHCAESEREAVLLHFFLHIDPGSINSFAPDILLLVENAV